MSLKHGKVLIVYIGSLFLGHCDHEKLVEHFYKFGSKLNLNSSYLMHLGMDGPNVNKAFEGKLLNCFKEDNGTEFLKLGTCSLHKVHNAFRTGLKELSFDFHTFTVAIHKLSSAKRENYSKSVDITDLVVLICNKTFLYKMGYFQIYCCAIVRAMEKPKQYFLFFFTKTHKF